MTMTTIVATVGAVATTRRTTSHGAGAMKVKYLGLKVGTILATMAATPVLWAALAYPEWQANSAAVAGDAAAPNAAPEAPARQVVIVPRYVDARTGEPVKSPVGGAPAPAPQQPVAGAPPPQPQTTRSQPTAPARSSATTRGS